MGSLFGGHLLAAGHDVTLVTSNAAHVAAVNEQGLVIRSAEGTLHLRPKAVLKPFRGRPADLLIVFVKAYKTAQAIEESRSLVGPDSRVLTLQNGLENAETIMEALGGQGRVFAGATYEAAVLEAPGLVRYSGGGWTVVAPWKVQDGRAEAERLADLLSEAGLKAGAAPDARQVIWTKVAVNAAINPVTALIGVENGGLLGLPTARRVMEAVIGETVAVAAAEGVSLTGDILDEVFQVARATAANRSSMLRDLDLARRTEVASLNGAIARRGEVQGVATPVNRILADLIRAREASGQKLLERSLDN